MDYGVSENVCVWECLGEYRLAPERGRRPRAGATVHLPGTRLSTRHQTRSIGPRTGPSRLFRKRSSRSSLKRLHILI